MSKAFVELLLILLAQLRLAVAVCKLHGPALPVSQSSDIHYPLCRALSFPGLSYLQQYTDMWQGRAGALQQVENKPQHGAAYTTTRQVIRLHHAQLLQPQQVP